MAIASVGSFLTHVQYCQSNRIWLLSVTIPRVFQMPCALRFLFSLSLSPSLSAYLPPSPFFVLILCFQMCLHVAVNVPSVWMCVCVCRPKMVQMRPAIRFCMCWGCLSILLLSLVCSIQFVTLLCRTFVYIWMGLLLECDQ